jgi:hypothetical protein
MNASVRRCWQVVRPGWNRSPSWPPAGGRPCADRGDHGDIVCGEPKMFADVRARDQPRGGFPAQPGLAHLEKPGGFDREQEAYFGDRLRGIKLERCFLLGRDCRSG